MGTKTKKSVEPSIEHYDRTKRWMVRHPHTRTFYTGQNPRLPAFGATEATGARYDTKFAALMATRPFPMFVEYELLRVEATAAELAS